MFFTAFNIKTCFDILLFFEPHATKVKSHPTFLGKHTTSDTSAGQFVSSWLRQHTTRKNTRSWTPDIIQMSCLFSILSHGYTFDNNALTKWYHEPPNYPFVRDIMKKGWTCRFDKCNIACYPIISWVVGGWGGGGGVGNGGGGGGVGVVGGGVGNGGGGGGVVAFMFVRL